MTDFFQGEQVLGVDLLEGQLYSDYLSRPGSQIKGVSLTNAPLATFQPDGLSECAVCRDVPYLHPRPTLSTQICVNSQRVLSEGLGG